LSRKKKFEFKLSRIPQLLEIVYTANTTSDEWKKDVQDFFNACRDKKGPLAIMELDKHSKYLDKNFDSMLFIDKLISQIGEESKDFFDCFSLKFKSSPCSCDNTTGPNHDLEDSKHYLVFNLKGQTRKMLFRELTLMTTCEGCNRVFPNSIVRLPQQLIIRCTNTTRTGSWILDEKISFKTRQEVITYVLVGFLVKDFNGLISHSRIDDVKWKRCNKYSFYSNRFYTNEVNSYDTLLGLAYSMYSPGDSAKSITGEELAQLREEFAEVYPNRLTSTKWCNNCSQVFDHTFTYCVFCGKI